MCSVPYQRWPYIINNTIPIVVDLIEINIGCTIITVYVFKDQRSLERK